MSNLPCPDCGSIRFGLHKTFQIEDERNAEDIFRGVVIEKKTQRIVVCDECGKPFFSVGDFHAKTPTIEVIVTGDSHGYRRKALIEYGKDSEHAEQIVRTIWDEDMWYKDDGKIFITLSTYKRRQGDLGIALQGMKQEVTNLSGIPL